MQAHIHGWWTQEVRVTSSAHESPPAHRLRTVAYGHGVNTEGESTCWEIHGYGPSVRFGLPHDIDWTETDSSGQPWRLRRLWDLMLAAGCRHYTTAEIDPSAPISAPQTRARRDRDPDHRPLSPECLYNCWTPIVPAGTDAQAWLPQVEYRRPLYYAHMQWDGDEKKYRPRLLPFLTVHFHHRSALAHFVRQCTHQPLVEHRMGAIELTVWEDHRALGVVEKMLVEYDLPSAGWVTLRLPAMGAAENSILSPRYVRGHVSGLRRDLAAQESRGRPSVTILSFDIECYASVEGTFPNPDNPQDVVFQIGCVLSTVAAGSDRRQYRRVLLSLQDPDPDDPLIVRRGVSVRAFATEYDLLIGFRDLVREWSPQIVVGYNVFGFDWKYLTARAEKHWRCLTEFMAFGARTTAGWVPGQLVTSGANVKFQSTTYIDAEGILMMDLLPFIRSGYKLQNYRLKTVAVHFLASTTSSDGDAGDASDDDVTKDPLTPQDIFRLYAENTRAGMARVGAYCVQDAELVNLLFAKLLVWYSVCESASINNIPIPFLYTRGEQIRMFLSVYRYAHAHQICVNMPVQAKDRDASSSSSSKKVKFKGAEVLSPVKGKHQNVLTFDFSSLYPSIIQAHNLDYTTLVRPPPTPDSPQLTGARASEDHDHDHDPDPDHCHIFRWTDHMAGCQCEAIPKAPSLQMAPAATGLAAWLTRPVRAGKAAAPAPKEARACVHHEYRFVREEMCAMGPGVVPSLLRGLLGARKVARVQEERYRRLADSVPGESAEVDAEVDAVGGRAAALSLSGVFEKRQLAYKVSANSMYGAMGASTGFLPVKPVAMCIPLIGRLSIRKVVTFMEAAPIHGRVIYGDTDSAFVGFPGLSPENSTPERLLAMGERLSGLASALFPPPMKLEFERIFEQILLASKKRYAAVLRSKAGSKLYVKGLVTSRRDSCPVVHDFFETALRSIFAMDDAIKTPISLSSSSSSSSSSRSAYGRTMAALADCVRRLLVRGGYPLESFVLTKELTSDPREYKSMPPHAGVAERMRTERGQAVPKKTRMELVLVRRPSVGFRPYEDDPHAKQEERMEDLDYFRGHRAYLELDIFQYWETQIANPLDEILHVTFPDRCRLGKRGGRAAALSTPMMSWLQERRIFARCMWDIRSRMGPRRPLFVGEDGREREGQAQQAELAQVGITGSSGGKSARPMVGGVGGVATTGSRLRRSLRRWAGW